MAKSHRLSSPEQDELGGESTLAMGRLGQDGRLIHDLNITPFISRLNANGDIILEKNTETEELLKDVLDAVPLMSIL